MPDVMRALLLVLVLCCGIYDLRVRRIPNWLTMPALLGGVVSNAFLIRHGLLLALAGAGCALLVYLPLYLVRGMGAGDVKLMAAVGAICGPSNWFLIFVATALVAGVASLIAITFYKRAQETAHNLGVIVAALLRFKSPAEVNPAVQVSNPGALRMPHGAFIASGAMLFLLMTKA